MIVSEISWCFTSLDQTNSYCRVTERRAIDDSLEYRVEVRIAFPGETSKFTFETQNLRWKEAQILINRFRYALAGRTEVLLEFANFSKYWDCDDHKIVLPCGVSPYITV